MEGEFYLVYFYIEIGIIEKGIIIFYFKGRRSLLIIMGKLNC